MSARSVTLARHRTWLTVIMVALVSVLITSRASAHAYLSRSDPADNAILDVAPSTMNLWFSEIISPEFSSAQLFNADGHVVDITVRTSPSDRALLILDFPELPDGVYTVRWRVLSEADGHNTQGLIVFGIGAGVDLGQAAAAEADTAVPLPEIILRWLTFSLYLGIVGAFIVTYLILNPASYPPNIARVLRAAQGRILNFAWQGSLLAFIVGVAWVIWQTILLSATVPEGIPFSKIAWQWLSQTRLGWLWWGRQTTLLLLAVGLRQLSKNDVGQETADPTSPSPTSSSLFLTFTPLLLAVLLITQSLTSHASALTPNTPLAVIADIFHLLAASFWVGGLLSLAIGLLPLVRQDKENFTTLVKAGWGSFGRLAALSVGILLATGLYGAGREVASIDALITTLYGRALLSKIGLMLAVGAFGALNSTLLHPRLAAPLARILRRPEGWTPLSLRRLPQLIIAEASLGLLVLLVTGLITAAPTAQGLEFAPTVETPSTLNQFVEDMVIGLTISPNRPGQNVFTVRASTTRRPPPADVLRVILRFTFLEQEAGMVSVDAEEIEPDLYLIGGNQLNLAGKWQIDAVIRRQGLEDRIASFEWNVPQGGPTRPIIVSNQPWEPILTLAAALLLILTVVIAVVRYRLLQ